MSRQDDAVGRSGACTLAYMLADGRVVTVLDDWAPPPFEGFYLYYPSRRQIRPALKVFVDFL